MGAASRIFGLSPFDPSNRYQTSWAVSPLTLAILRGIISIYVFTALIYTLGWSSVNDPERVSRHWSYFTNITNWSEAFYFAFAAFHGWQYARTGSAPLERWWSGLKYLHGLLYTTVITFPILVTLVYWIILAPDNSPFHSRFDAWSNISVHALNSVWALFEIIVPRTERPLWINLVFLIIFLALYLALAYVTKATQGFYTYGFLDPSKGKGKLVGYVFGILVGICVLFAIVWLLVWLRLWLTEKVLKKDGKLAERKMAEKEMHVSDVEYAGERSRSSRYRG